jgi:hypothetical protein
MGEEAIHVRLEQADNMKSMLKRQKEMDTEI